MERLRDFCVWRGCVIFLTDSSCMIYFSGSCMIFFALRLCDFFGEVA